MMGEIALEKLHAGGAQMLESLIQHRKHTFPRLGGGHFRCDGSEIGVRIP